MVRRVLLLAVVARTAAFATVLLSADLDADRHLFESLDVDESDSLDAGELVMLWDELSYEAGDLPMGYEAFHAKMDGQLRDIPPPRRDVISWGMFVTVQLDASDSNSCLMRDAEAQADAEGQVVLGGCRTAASGPGIFEYTGGRFVDLETHRCLAWVGGLKQGSLKLVGDHDYNMLNRGEPGISCESKQASWHFSRDNTSGDDNYEIASDGNVAGCLAAPQDPQDYWRSRSETYLAKTPGLVVCGNGASKMTALNENHVWFELV